MSRRITPVSNEAFVCSRCGCTVGPAGTGTEHRNHCPRCLWSRHVDLKPGDRRAGCRGEMQPIAVWIRRDGEWSILHRCAKCGIIKPNRIAGDDDEVQLFALAARPLTKIPFPSDGVFQRLMESNTI